jgi:hypothetical protein
LSFWQRVLLSWHCCWQRLQLKHWHWQWQWKWQSLFWLNLRQWHWTARNYKLNTVLSRTSLSVKVS